MASQHVTMRPNQMVASIHRGTERRTGGTTMAAAMPANRASENCTMVVFPIERETRPVSRVLGGHASALTAARQG